MSETPKDVNQESSKEATVTSINDKKPRRTRTPKENTEDKNSGDGNKKTKKADIYESIFNSVMRTIHKILPEPNFKIATVEISEGIKTPIQIKDNGECQRVSFQYIADLLMDYTRTVLNGLELYRFTARDCRDCADYWQMASTPLSRPPHVLFKSDPGLCWNRLPFDRHRAQTPLFDELFSRMTNALAVKAWIGSLFETKSYRQQYVWIYGQGNDGKSALLGFLARVFGYEGALSQSKAPGGEHWGEQYPGKRFIFFPDFKDFSSLDNGPLKQITGGDRIYINPKHKAGYMAELECKLAFSSNHMPPIDLQKANLRRIIFAEMQTTTSFDSDYEEKLWDEGGAFLQSCKEIYEQLCPKHEPILVSDESIHQLTAWGAREDDEYALWFSDFFHHSPNSEISPEEVTKRILFRFKDFKAKRGVYDWLHKHDYRRIRIKRNNKLFWIYKNLSVKQFDPSL